MGNAITVQHLAVRYKSFTAVEDVSLHVTEGEIFGLIGPNGAGKTSTIECLEGLRRPAAGKLSVLGASPADHKRLYANIGVQLQEASFPDGIKVGEVCRLFSSFYAKPLDYRALLARFDLADKERSLVKKLSGGQKQKLSIVAALIGNPKILFLDELTTGLDPQARVDMWTLVKSLRSEGKTIFMTTHFMDEAEYLCDRVCLMVKGRIVAMGTVPELVAQADVSQKITFASVAPRVELLQALAGVRRIAEENGRVTLWGTGKNLLRDVVVCITDNDIPFEDLHSSNPGLEDVFLKLTGTRMEDAL